MVEILIFSGLGALAGLLLARRRRRLVQIQKAPLKARREPTPWDLLPGDIVGYTNEDFLVERALTYEDEGPRFREILMMSGAAQARLLVVPREPPVLVKPIGPPDGAQALPDRINWSGRDYRLLRRGQATVQGERYQYADYEAPPGRMLLLRIRLNTPVKAFAGEQISAPGLLELMPGS